MFELFASFWSRLRALRVEDLQAFDLFTMLVVLAISLMAALALALMYSLFFARRSTGSDIHRAFPALGTAITAIFLCLQSSLPLSLGLLGALSIVRFRTPIKEPEEIGFLMLLIATSICCATLNLPLLALLLALLLVALTALHFAPGLIGRRTPVATLVLIAPSGEFERNLPAVRQCLRGVGPHARLDSIADAGGTTTASISLYRGNAESLAKAQQQLRGLVAGSEVSLFLLRPQAL
jgi:hypothetical protein